MKQNLTRRNFLKFGGAALAAGSLNLVSGFKAFAAPAPKDFGTVRFAVISDPHVDIKGENGMKMSAYSVECVKKTVSALNMDDQIKFVHVNGDLLLDGEWENARAIKAELDKLTAPYTVVPGNHDFKPVDAKKHREGFTYLTIEEFAKLFEGHGYDASGSRYWAQEVVPGLRIIGLDANMPLEEKKWGGVMDDGQMAWLGKQLLNNPDSMHVLFIHHNLVSWSADELQGGPKEWFCVDNAAQVRELLTKYAAAAPMVIQGHRHIGYNIKELGGVNYIASPSVNSHPMRYTIYDVSRTGFAWQTPAVPVPTAVHLEARENLLNATWWRASEFAERNSINDMEVLALYENNGLRMGQKMIKA